VALAVLGVCVSLTGMLWPELIPVVLYGCAPGALVLVLVIAVQWVLQRRYRRQVVFLPGFSRLAPGSSIIRSGSSHRRRDASTVDVPPGAAPQ
jgi:hypothetical protein